MLNRTEFHSYDFVRDGRVTIRKESPASGSVFESYTRIFSRSLSMTSKPTQIQLLSPLDHR